MTLTEFEALTVESIKPSFTWKPQSNLRGLEIEMKDGTKLNLHMTDKVMNELKERLA